MTILVSTLLLSMNSIHIMIHIMLSFDTCFYIHSWFLSIYDDVCVWILRLISTYITSDQVNNSDRYYTIIWYSFICLSMDGCCSLYPLIFVLLPDCFMSIKSFLLFMSLRIFALIPACRFLCLLHVHISRMHVDYYCRCRSLIPYIHPFNIMLVSTFLISMNSIDIVLSFDDCSSIHSCTVYDDVIVWILRLISISHRYCYDFCVDICPYIWLWIRSISNYISLCLTMYSCTMLDARYCTPVSIHKFHFFP